MSMSSVWPFDAANEQVAETRPGVDASVRRIPTERWGGMGAQDWRVWRDGITAAMVPTDITMLESVLPFHKYPKIEWLILAPPGVTAYDYSQVRYIGVPFPSKASKGYTFGRVVVEAELTVAAAPFDQLFTHVRQADPVAIAITSITGAITPWTDAGIAKPNNPAGVPDGFIILWRPASSSV